MAVAEASPPRSAGRAAASSTATAGSRLRLALFAAGLLASFAGLSTLLAGWTWWFVCALAVLLPALGVALAGALGRRPWQPFVTGAAAAVGVLTVGFARDVSLLGVVPTSETIGRWRELVDDGIIAITTQRIPAQATEGILFLLTVLAVVAVLVVVPVLGRFPAVAALPLLVVLGIPVAVSGGIAEPHWFVFAAVAYLALLRVGRRRMPLPGVVGTGALVIVGSLLLPVVFPEPRDGAGSAGGVVATGLNPLVDLGEDLRRDQAVDALRYVSDAPDGLYLRLATLDTFTGITWTPDAATGPANDVATFPPAPGLADDVPRAPATVDITIEDAGGRWLPVPYPATSVSGLEGDWAWEPDGLAVRSAGADVRGQAYQVSFLDIQPDRAQLTADTPPDVAERFLALPAQLPASIQEVADQVAGSGSTYQRAIALQEFFTGGDFAYSVDTPVEEGYDGTGIGVIEQFLKTRSGYCVHFASSMAVMARAVGIPSRLVVGFQPGVRSTVGDRNEFAVDSFDLHAWPELYFENIGWLRFEPTPGRGSPPEYSSLETVDDPQTPEFEGADPAAVPNLTPTVAPTAAADEPVDEDRVVPDRRGPVPIVLATALVLLGLALIPAIWRAGVRARRMRLVRTSADAAAAWAEIRDTARDHDWLAPDSETPRQLGSRLAIVVGAGVVTPLRHGVEAAAYDRPGSGAITVEEVRALRRAIASAATWRVRLRAVLLPPSLTARVGLSRSRGEGAR